MFRAFGVLLSSLFLLAVLQLEGVRALYRLEAKACADTIPDCYKYLDLCNNTAYVHLMEQKCAQSCSFCTPSSACEDKDSDCALMYPLGICQDPTALANCLKTCNVCDSAGCSDNSKSCAMWYAHGFCDSPDYSLNQKKEYCAKTCGLC